MAKNRFSSFPATPEQPPASIVEIVPDDATDLDEILLGLNVESPGRVRVTTADGSTGSVFVAAGIFFPLRVVRVWASGTTATGIRGLT